MIQPPLLAACPDPADALRARRVVAGNHAAFEALMRQYNGRLFRLARVILKDDSEAESALQEAYIAAYSNVKTLGDYSKLSIWLSRIVVHESLGRLREQKCGRVVIPFPSAGHHSLEIARTPAITENRIPPEDAALRAEIRELIERNLDGLPVALRMVFVLRELEGMTVEETAECLGVSKATVHDHLSRTKSLFRTLLEREIDFELRDVFAFGGDRCEHIVEAVLGRISNDENHT